MKDYLIFFFLTVMVIVCVTELILSIRRGESGMSGETRMGHSFFDDEYRPMWILIGTVGVLFILAYLLIEVC